MSKARSIGTRAENHWLPVLRLLFHPVLDPEADDHPIQRAPLKGTKDHGDYVGVPWLHESKGRSSGAATRPMFLKWAGQARKKTEGDLAPWRWVVRWKGDLRRGEGPYVLMGDAFYTELVRFAIKGGLLEDPF